MLRCPNELRYIILYIFTAPREKIIFLGFLGSGTQIVGGQNTISTATPSLSNISSAVRGVE